MGQSLFAPVEAGVLSPRDPAYRKRVNYLLATQHADRSSYVRSRALKFQPYFESGFPYAHDQGISSMATGWAATALTLAPDGAATQAECHCGPTRAEPRHGTSDWSKSLIVKIGV